MIEDADAVFPYPSPAAPRVAAPSLASALRRVKDMQFPPWL
jgi:hypothetical protein